MILERELEVDRIKRTTKIKEVDGETVEEKEWTYKLTGVTGTSVRIKLGRELDVVQGDLVRVQLDQDSVQAELPGEAVAGGGGGA